ncbi:MAG: hypothetical protein U0Q16_31795 [Bryobacteraceae bacterium]
MTSASLTKALIAYAALALLGSLLVSGRVLAALLIFLGGLVAKSYIAWRIAEDERKTARSDKENPEVN